MVYLPFVVRRGGSRPVVAIAVISIDLHAEKRHQQGQKVRIRREGKIKACGTTARDRSRIQCLHIGLSTVATVLQLHNEARQPRIRAASICAFSQYHQGPFTRFRFAVSLGAWRAPTMTRAFVHAEAARAAGTIGGCWPRRRSSRRSHGRVHWPGRPAGHLRPVHGILATCRPSAAGARPSRAGGRPHHGAGRRRGPAHAASSSRPGTSRCAQAAARRQCICATSSGTASPEMVPRPTLLRHGGPRGRPRLSRLIRGRPASVPPDRRRGGRGRAVRSPRVHPRSHAPGRARSWNRAGLGRGRSLQHSASAHPHRHPQCR